MQLVGSLWVFRFRTASRTTLTRSQTRRVRPPVIRHTSQLRSSFIIQSFNYSLAILNNISFSLIDPVSMQMFHQMSVQGRQSQAWMDFARLSMSGSPRLFWSSSSSSFLGGSLFLQSVLRMKHLMWSLLFLHLSMLESDSMAFTVRWTDLNTQMSRSMFFFYQDYLSFPSPHPLSYSMIRTSLFLFFF